MNVCLNRLSRRQSNIYRYSEPISFNACTEVPFITVCLVNCLKSRTAYTAVLSFIYGGRFLIYGPMRLRYFKLNLLMATFIKRWLGPFLATWLSMRMYQGMFFAFSAVTSFAQLRLSSINKEHDQYTEKYAKILNNRHLTTSGSKCAP